MVKEVADRAKNGTRKAGTQPSPRALNPSHCVVSPMCYLTAAPEGG